MDRPHVRPRLEIVVPADIAAVRQAFAERVAHPSCTCRGTFASNHLHVEVGPERQHFWSPTLDVTLRERDGGTVLLGRFGPHPHVWTLYVFAYGALVCLAVASLSWGLAQLAMGWSPTGFWGLGLTGVVAAAVWVSGRVGASMGHAQMEDLFCMVDGLGEARRDEAHVARRGESAGT